MPSEEEEPKPEEIVSWEFTRKLAEDLDKAALDRVFAPRDGNVRRGSTKMDNEWVSYNPGVGDSYTYSEVCDLTADISTPFPLKLPMEPGILKDKTNKHTLWQRFEFAYYNYGPNGEYLYECTGKREGFSVSEEERAPRDEYKWRDRDTHASYTKRYYFDNTRQPVMYASYVTDDKHRAVRPSEMLDPDNTDERVVQAGDTVMSQFVVNLMESHRHLLFKTIPGVSAYSSVPTIAAELYFMTMEGLPFNCRAVTRMCVCRSEDYCHNGNGNGYVYPNLPHGAAGVRGRPYQACGRLYAMNGLSSFTLAARDWKYVPEAFSSREAPDTAANWHDAVLYTPPPICSGCQDVRFPCIGLEAGVRAWDDGSNFGLPGNAGGYDNQLSYNSLGNRPCDLYDETVFHPGFTGAVTPSGTKVVDWDPAKARRPQKTRGSGTRRLGRKQRQLRRLKYRYCKEGYRKYWCHPEDVEWYEAVSKYEVWGIGSRGALVRVTPIRFRDEIKLRNGDTAVRHYNFVWVPTAISFQIGGRLTAPIRKRWYDMLEERARYVSGYWPHDYTIREAINFDKGMADDAISRNSSRFLRDAEFADFTIQHWNGCDDERSIHVGEGQPRIDTIPETPCTDFDTGKRDLRAFTHDVLLPDGALPNTPSPLGVTWDYACETKWNPMDMQCARWLAEGPRTGSAVIGWTSEVPDVNLSCGAYFGTRYWDSMVATLNAIGRSIDDGEDYRLMEIDTDGGFCTMPYTDECGEDTPTIYDPLMPWWGGCGNTVCNPRYNSMGLLAPTQTYNVHAFTLIVLRRLVNFIARHKHVEEPAGWIATDDWKACSPDTYSSDMEREWSGPWYYTMDYTVPVYTIPPHTPTYIPTHVPTPTPEPYPTYIPYPTPEPTPEPHPTHIPYPTPEPTPEPHPTHIPYPTAVPCDHPYATLTNLGLLPGVGYWCWIEDAGGTVLATSYGVYELRDGGSPYELQMMINDLSTGPIYMYDLVEVENPMQASTRLVKAPHTTQDLYNAKLKVFKGTAAYKIAVAEIVLSECDTPAYAPSRLAAPKASTLQFDGSVADMLSSSIGILSASSIKSNDLANGCEWHEEDHGDWKYYWCNAYGGMYNGQLPYERFTHISGCYADEECVWAGYVETLLPPENTGLAGVRSYEHPEPGNAKSPWWGEDTVDRVVVKVACSSDNPMTAGMVWCPYLIGHEGLYEITIVVTSPMKRGPRAPEQNAVRGYIEGMCGPSGFDPCTARTEGESGSMCASEPEKYAATEDAPTDGPCPRLTDLNKGGGTSIAAWKAGWEPNASIIGTGGMTGRGTCEGYTYDVWEYLKDPDQQKCIFKTTVKVENGQQRGYLGLTFIQGGFAAHGNSLDPGEFEDNIEKYVYCPHDEYYLVHVEVSKLEENESE